MILSYKLYLTAVTALTILLNIASSVEHVHFVITIILSLSTVLPKISLLLGREKRIPRILIKLSAEISTFLSVCAVPGRWLLSKNHPSSTFLLLRRFQTSFPTFFLQVYMVSHA
uniref:Uncharacterized protein n=1 Tax=Cacopsylla melanoneura TaxID=428564 RepID=A0A8D9BL54_9HEMI